MQIQTTMGYNHRPLEWLKLKEQQAKTDDWNCYLLLFGT